VFIVSGGFFVQGFKPTESIAIFGKFCGQASRIFPF
jgi:hypothetical protein